MRWKRSSGCWRMRSQGGGRLLNPPQPKRAQIEKLLARRHVRVMSLDDWHVIDQIERERGQAIGRERIKFTHIEDMLAALADYHSELAPG